jgi:hypothetical protein
VRGVLGGYVIRSNFISPSLDDFHPDRSRPNLIEATYVVGSLLLNVFAGFGVCYWWVGVVLGVIQTFKFVSYYFGIALSEKFRF